MKIFTLYSLFILLGNLIFNTISIAGSSDLEAKLVSKEPQINSLSVEYSFYELNDYKTDSLCLEECKGQNRMVSMGIEAIIENCQWQCDINEARAMSKSNDPEKTFEGTKALCEIADKSIAPDLISLLQEDMIKRTGSWANIIPTLGTIRDSRTVPTLVDLVTLPDEHWIGREMTVIGDNSAVPVLIIAAWRGYTRSAVIIALSKIKDKRAVPVLLSAIQQGEEPHIREAATLGLVSFGSEVVPAIENEFNNYSPENLQSKKRVWLCDVLGEIGGEKSLEVLRNNKNDQDTAVNRCTKKYL